MYGLPPSRRNFADPPDFVGPKACPTPTKSAAAISRRREKNHQSEPFHTHGSASLGRVGCGGGERSLGGVAVGRLRRNVSPLFRGGDRSCRRSAAAGEIRTPLLVNTQVGVRVGRCVALGVSFDRDARPRHPAPRIQRAYRVRGRDGRGPAWGLRARRMRRSSCRDDMLRKHRSGRHLLPDERRRLHLRGFARQAACAGTPASPI